MRESFKIVMLLSFVALILIKVSGFHAYSHLHEDSDIAIENCSSCELAVEQQQDDFIAPEILELDVVNTSYSLKVANVGYVSFTLTSEPSYFFSRPPPSFL